MSSYREDRNVFAAWCPWMRDFVSWRAASTCHFFRHWETLQFGISRITDYLQSLLVGNLVADIMRVLVRNDSVTVPATGEIALGPDFFLLWRLLFIFFGVKNENRCNGCQGQLNVYLYPCQNWLVECQRYGHLAEISDASWREMTIYGLFFGT